MDTIYLKEDQPAFSVLFQVVHVITLTQVHALDAWLVTMELLLLVLNVLLVKVVHVITLIRIHAPDA